MTEVTTRVVTIYGFTQRVRKEKRKISKETNPKTSPTELSNKVRELLQLIQG